MKTITITVDLDGEKVVRKYAYDFKGDWGDEVESMIDTIEKSKDPVF